MGGASEALEEERETGNDECVSSCLKFSKKSCIKKF